MSPLKVFYMALLICCLAAVSGNAKEKLCSMRFFADESQQIEAENFSVFDKVYMQCICRQLSAGSHELSTVWYTPSGEIQRQDTQSFSLPVSAGYKASFWMKLLPKTTFQEISSNRSFDDKYYGNWTVNLYLEDEQVSSATFRIQ